MADSDNVKIRYSLRPMTSLWRHICKLLKIRTYRQNTALFHSRIQRLLIHNNQLFNIRQQEYYLVTDELKCHNLCLKYPHFCLTHEWICLHESPTTFSCSNIISRQWW